MKSFLAVIHRSRSRALCAAIVCASCACMAQSSAPVSYNITLSSPAQHLVQVQIVLPPGPAQRDLQLPVWNALYQVRDFSQYVNWVRAQDRSGRELVLRELDKSRWQMM